MIFVTNCSRETSSKWLAGLCLQGMEKHEVAAWSIHLLNHFSVVDARLTNTPLVLLLHPGGVAIGQPGRGLGWGFG